MCTPQRQRDLRLSAVLLMLEDFPSKTMRHLLAQTALDSLEVILVTTPEKKSEVDTELLAQAGGWQIVTIPRFETAALGWAAGVRKSRAPLAVLCEDHSFPEPDWAEALITEHSEKWAAAAPRVHNANPSTAVSWANFLLCFLNWYRPEPLGRVASAPGHNTCYRVSSLAPYKDSLEDWFNPEGVLHLDMQARGLKILQSTAATHHVNISLAGSFLAHSFVGGRLFGGVRASHWPKAKAVAHACAFPLVPLIRLWRILTHLRTVGTPPEVRMAWVLPWIMAGLLCHAAGEALGYVAGAGNSMKRYMSYETRRRDHVTPSELALLEDQEYRPSIFVY